MYFSNTNQPIRSLYLWRSHTQGHYSHALITPRPDTRQLGTPRRPLKLFKPANPNPIYLALPVPSHATTGTTPVCTSSLSQCLMTNASVSLCAPHGMACPLLLGTLCNKLSFQCQLSSDLLALLYLDYSINTHIQNRSGKLSTLSYSLSSICT